MAGTERRAPEALDTPKGLRSLRPIRFESDRFGRGTEAIARWMGTPAFIVALTIFVVIWILWNSIAPQSLRFDSAAFGFTALTLVLSLQASYAAPLILLAQNRQDDRDRVGMEQDRQRAEREPPGHRVPRAGDRRAPSRSRGSRDEGLRPFGAEGAPRRPRRREAGVTTPLLAAVSAVRDPELRRTLGELGMIRGAALDGRGARVDLALTVAYCPAAERIEADVRAAALAVDGRRHGRGRRRGDVRGGAHGARRAGARRAGEPLRTGGRSLA